MNWKIIAIIFICLFVSETAFMVWGLILVNQEEANINQCYYEICSEYPQAELEGDVCYCYDYDLLGDYVLVKTELIK